MPLFLILFFSIFTSNAQAQNNTDLSSNNLADSFFSITRNTEWVVSKLYSTSNQTDKKSYLNNCVLNFNQSDTSKFLIKISGKNNMTGGWTFQGNNKVLFSLPLIAKDSSWNASTDSVYNEGVKLLCAWPLQIAELRQSLIKFNLHDPMYGESFIEFAKKE